MKVGDHSGLTHVVSENADALEHKTEEKTSHTSNPSENHKTTEFDEKGKSMAKGELAFSGQARAAELQSIAQDFSRKADNKPELDVKAGGQTLNPDSPAGWAFDDKLKKSYDDAKQAATSIKEGFDSLLETGKKIAESGDLARPINEDDVKKTASEVSKSVSDIGSKMDPGKEIDNMKDGDKITLAGGASGGVGFAKVGGKGSIELSKEGNNYKLTVDAEAAASFGIGTGVGGKVEMTFKNAEEAKRALAAAVPNKKSPEDAKFLKEHVSALEVRQQWTPPGADLAKGLVGVSSKEENTLRIEYKDGKPAYMVVKCSVTGEGTAGGSTKAVASVEQRIPIDENFPVEKLTAKQLKDPFQDLTPEERKSLERGMRNSEMSVSVESDSRYNTGGGGGGVRFELRATGKPQDLEDPATQKALRSALKEAENGNIQKGVESFGKNVRFKVDGKAQYYETTGVEVKTPDLGIGVEFQATSQKVRETKVYSSQSEADRTSKASEEAIGKLG